MYKCMYILLYRLYWSVSERVDLSSMLISAIVSCVLTTVLFVCVTNLTRSESNINMVHEYKKNIHYKMSDWYTSKEESIYISIMYDYAVRERFTSSSYISILHEEKFCWNLV